MKVKLMSPATTGEGCPVYLTQPPYTKVGTITVVTDGDMEGIGITVELDMLKPNASGEKPKGKRRGRRKRVDSDDQSRNKAELPSTDSHPASTPTHEVKKDVPF